MKKILIIAALFLTCGTSFAQNVVGGYGHQPTLQRSTTSMNPEGVLRSQSTYTMTATAASDTVYTQWQNPNSYYQVADLFMTTQSGTLAGTGVMYGSNASTMPVPTSKTWQALTGVTTYCSGCVGASATITGASTTQYTWHMPEIGSDYQFYQIRAIVTPTCSATFSTRVTYKN